MNVRTFVITALALGALCIYLFVSASPPLDVGAQTAQATVPVNSMFDLLAAENEAARTLYTSRIVGPGLKAGLKFDEKWREEDVEAGPLPALFLREVSGLLSRGGTEIGLFLGSDFPIVAANLFSGEQMKTYAKVKATHDPQYSRDTASGMYVAMYADYASAKGCVSCHNEHADSPKTDWVLTDMMGATTWLFPRPQVSVEKAVAVVAAFRVAARATYEGYLEKAKKFKSDRPTIGDKWPADGLYLPDADTFMKAVSDEASGDTLSRILALPGKADD